MEVYNTHKFEGLQVELTIAPNTENEKTMYVAEGDKLFKLVIDKGNYGSAAVETIPECTVVGFTMRPMDVKRQDLRTYDGVYATYGNRVAAMTRELLENVAVVRDMVVALPVEEGEEDVSKRVAISSILDVVVADAIVDTPEELIDAIENAEPGSVIEIMGDMTLTEPLSIKNDVILDLGGKTITGSIIIDASSGAIRNGTIVSENGAAVTLQHDGTVVIGGGAVLEGADDALKMTGCVATIADCTLKAKAGYAIHSVSGDNSIYVLGGTMIGEAGALKADVVTNWEITGGTFSSDPSEYVDLEVYRVVENDDGTYSIKVSIPYTIDWYSTFVPTDTRITRTTTGRVTIYENGTPLPNKAAYTEQLANWELVYDPEYLMVSTAPTAYASYINFVLKGVKAGETTIEYRNKLDPSVKVSKTIKIDHYLALNVDPAGVHVVEKGPVRITSSSTFDGEAMNTDEYTFTSSDITIATIDGVTITPVKGGSITVTATRKDDESIFATANINFVEAAAKIGDEFYDTVNNAMKAAASGDLIVLQRDVVESINFSGNSPRVEGFSLDIDLNGHVWTAAAGQNYALRVDYGVITVKDSVGTGAVTYSSNYAFMVSHLAADYTSKLILEAGTFTGKTSVLQAGLPGGSGKNYKYYGGEIEVRGGTFVTVPDADESYDEQGNFKFTLNMLDMNESQYAGGIYSPSKITVMGGTFQKFDPANNVAEGPNTNFVAEGYGSVKEGDNYKVVPNN